ncbi:MAG: lysylphosphatidylglycerol synthase domain-containing protein, partial [Nitrososphaerota archaeon]|nr:lysylphosphatidylglycerol synthase domain-containing protein [Nitrososphaerota archaeon]
MTFKRVFLNILQFLVGIVIIIILFQQANFEKIIEILLKSNLMHIMIALILILTASTMIALSFFIILFSLNYKVNFISCFQANFAGQLASDLTPGRAGYFITPFVMGILNKMPFEACLVATMVSGMIDFLIRSILVILSVAFLIGPIESLPGIQWIIIISALILTVSSISFAILLWSEKPRRLFLKLRGFKKISSLIDSYMRHFEDFQKEGAKVRKYLIPVVPAMLLTCVFDSIAL